MAPVVLALRQHAWAQVRVVATAQHRHLLDQVLQVFEIVPDLDLDLMMADQSLATLSARLIEALDRVYADESPDLVLAQGDTTTVLMAALSAFYRQVPFGHVEAGLRTGNLRLPFPEEMNRVLAARLGVLHFAPTERAAACLRQEGVDPGSVFVTGNTVIDSLLSVAEQATMPAAVPWNPRSRLILLTAHRREHFGAALKGLFGAIRELVNRHPDVELLYPVHPNPNVRGSAYAELGGHPRIHLSDPLDYLSFVAAMKAAHLILTDSGGIQEEAPALATPVLVMRNDTERPEAVEAGVVRMVGTDGDRLLTEAGRLLDDNAAYRAMARGVSPYGDGHAAARIVDHCRRFLGT